MVASRGVLVDRAVRQAGSSDLGPGGWQVGLDRLLEAVGEDVHDDDAVVRIEALVVDRLVQRLRIERWYAEHGAEASAPVDGPLVILGLPRTATTALNHLLSLDPQFRYPRSWELRDPVPPPTLATEAADPRRAAAAAAPRVDVRHIVSVDGPAEDWSIHVQTFDHAELVLPVPSYAAWWRTREHDALFPHHERVLRMLQSDRPPHRWLLKNPAYVFLIEELAAHYADAQFVVTHRDPVTVIASTCSTVADSRRQRIPSWSPEPEFGSLMLEHWIAGTERMLAARAALGEDRFVDVGQHQLEADAVGTAERIYAGAGLDLTGPTADTMRSWAAENRRGARGAHRYSLEEYGLEPSEVEAAFTPYLERFGDLCRP